MGVPLGHALPPGERVQRGTRFCILTPVSCLLVRGILLCHGTYNGFLRKAQIMAARSITLGFLFSREGFLGRVEGRECFAVLRGDPA